MNNKNIWTSILYIILFISAFVLLQVFGSWIAKGCYALSREFHCLKYPTIVIVLNYNPLLTFLVVF